MPGLISPLVVRLLLTVGVLTLTLLMVRRGLGAAEYTAALVGLSVLAFSWLIDVEGLVVHASRLVFFGVEVDRRIQLAQEVIDRLASLEASAGQLATRLDHLTAAADAGREQLEMLLLAQRAGNDDRHAFDNLLKIADTDGHPFREVAQETINAAVSNIAFSIRLGATVPWKPGIDPKTLPMVRFRHAYVEVPRMLRPDVLSALWSSEMPSKRQKLKFLAQIMRSDDSLRAVDRACRLMNQEAKLDQNFLGVSNYLRWWKENRSRYPPP